MTIANQVVTPLNNQHFGVKVQRAAKGAPKKDKQPKECLELLFGKFVAGRADIARKKNVLYLWQKNSMRLLSICAL